jgi:hypothetical protein
MGRNRENVGIRGRNGERLIGVTTPAFHLGGGTVVARERGRWLGETRGLASDRVSGIGGDVTPRTVDSTRGVTRYETRSASDSELKPSFLMLAN